MKMSGIRIRQIGSLMVMIIALTMTITVHAAATAQLYTNETHKSTSTVQNGGNGFYYLGNVGATSAHKVTFVVYVGNSASNCNITKEQRECQINETLSQQDVDDEHYFGKLTMYGNTKESKKKDCIATGGIDGR